VRCIYSQIYLVGVLDNVVIIFGRIKLCTGLTFGYLSLPRNKLISLKVKMATRKSRRRDGAINIELSDIKSTSSCISLGFMMIRELCCDNCKTQLDAQIGMSKKSSVRKKDIEITKKVEGIDANNHGHLGIAAQHVIIL